MRMVSRERRELEIEKKFRVVCRPIVWTVNTYEKQTSELFQAQKQEKNWLVGPKQKSNMKDEEELEQYTF